MSEAIEQNQDTRLMLKIEGDLTIYTVGRIKAEIQAQLTSGEDFHLDLSQVAGIDTAGLQLLVAANNAVARWNKELKLHGTPEAVEQFFKQCGFCSSFDLHTSEGDAPCH
jgi:anti-sigma B factor antagonist